MAGSAREPTLVFWGSGATRALGIRTTLDQGKFISTLLGANTSSKPLQETCEALACPNTEVALGTHGTIERTQQIRYLPQKPDATQMLGLTRAEPRAHMQNFLCDPRGPNRILGQEEGRGSGRR